MIRDGRRVETGDARRGQRHLTRTAIDAELAAPVSMDWACLACTTRTSWACGSAARSTTTR